MAEPTTAELLERVERLQAQVETLESTRRHTTHRRGTRMALGVLVAAALLAVPIGVFASHSFTDVPDSNTFHTQIGRVKGAGITAGCTATTYCPDANVTRGQMAAFLARTGGRNNTSGIGDEGGPTVGDSTVVLKTVTIKAGDVTGGYAMVQLTGAVSIYTSSATGLPSYVVGYIRETGTSDILSSYGLAQVDALAGGGYGAASAPLVGSVVVPTGVTKTFEVVAHRQWGTGTFVGIGALSATYVPFSGDGTSATPPSAPQPAPESGSEPGPVVR
jgi:hypothetical protein